MTILTALLCLSISVSAQGFSETELSARYYHDLGPDQVDVSSYPEVQRGNYKTFERVCTQCHVLARAINSPIFSRHAWGYYLFRMRLRAEGAPNISLSEPEIRQVQDFLVYDSNARKLVRRREFMDLTKKLKARFDAVLTERIRQLQKKTPKQPFTPSGD